MLGVWLCLVVPTMGLGEVVGFGWWVDCFYCSVLVFDLIFIWEVLLFG